MMLDTGASIAVVSRGYLKKMNLAKHIVKGEKHAVQTADEIITSTEKLIADFRVWGTHGEPRFFRMDVIVLPTENLVPFLFPLRNMKEGKVMMNFATGVATFHPEDRDRRFELRWESCAGGMVVGIEVWPVVGKGEPRKAMVVYEPENGRSPGWTRGGR
jgi:hypothetical protein